MAVIGPQPQQPSPPSSTLVPPGGGGQLPQQPRPAPAPNIARPPGRPQPRPRDNAMSQDLMRFGLQRAGARQDWERAEETRKSMMKDQMKANQFSAFLTELSSLSQTKKSEANAAIVQLGALVPSLYEKFAGDADATEAELLTRLETIIQGTYPVGSTFERQLVGLRDRFGITPELDEEFGGVAGDVEARLRERAGEDLPPYSSVDWDNYKDAPPGEIDAMLKLQGAMDAMSFGLSQHAEEKKGTFFEKISKKVTVSQQKRIERGEQQAQELMAGILGYDPAVPDELLEKNPEFYHTTNLATATRHNLGDLARILSTDPEVRGNMSRGGLFTAEKSEEVTRRTIPNILKRIFQPLGESGGFDHGEFAYSLFQNPDTDQDPFLKRVYGMAMQDFGQALMRKSGVFLEGKDSWWGGERIDDPEAFKSLVSHVGSQLLGKGLLLQKGAAYHQEVEEFLDAITSDLAGLGGLSPEEAKTTALNLNAKLRAALPQSWTPDSAVQNLRDMGIGSPPRPDAGLPPFARAPVEPTPAPLGLPSGPVGPPAPQETFLPFDEESD